MIKINSLSKEYVMGDNKLLALNDVSVSINKGEFVSIMGSSGSGKSTLMNIIGGLIKADQQEILIDEKPINSKSSLGYVFQTSRLLPWLTLYENIELVCENKNEKIKNKIKSILNNFDLKEFIDSYPNSISGGMRRKVSLARAVVNDPKVLLMDEPFGALDELTRMEMNDLLLKINYQEKNTVIFVTHSISEAIYLSDTVHVFSKRPAEIMKTINISLPHPRKPTDRYTNLFKQLELDAGEALGVIR